MPRPRLIICTLAGVLTLAGLSLPGAAAVSRDDHVAQTEVAQTEPLPALGALGANYNENLDQVNYRELRSARASWVRGFYALPEADDVPPARSDTIRAIHDAHDRGFQT